MRHMIKLDQYMARHNLLQSLIRLTQYSLNQVSSEYETLSVLYFNTTIFKIINNLSLQQIQSRQLTANAIIKLFNVCYIYSNSAIKYCASDIILDVDSDASYLSFPRLVFAQDITIISYLKVVYQPLYQSRLNLTSRLDAKVVLIPKYIVKRSKHLIERKPSLNC